MQLNIAKHIQVGLGKKCIIIKMAKVGETRLSIHMAPSRSFIVFRGASIHAKQDSSHPTLSQAKERIKVLKSIGYMSHLEDKSVPVYLKPEEF
jgi:hypothetical protein